MKDWSIAISSWGGTSFYGLDLSNVNFRGAQLANTDLRAKSLYRTCFQEVIGLDQARVDDHYLDLSKPHVQTLLTRKESPTSNFQRVNLRGAFLHHAKMSGFSLTDANLTDADLQDAKLRDCTLIRTQLASANLQQADLRDSTLIDANLTGADCRGADLRDAIVVRAQAARVDFTGATLTGICIEDWSISSQTRFTDVRCDYVFRSYENGKPSRRYPVDRNFEPDEFAALFQEADNELELVFKGELDYTALSLAFYKLQTDEPELNLELKGIEQRGTLWLVKVTSSNPAIEKQLAQWLSASYASTPSSVETIKNLRSTYQDAVERKSETEAPLKQIFNFYISGGNITNLAGQGEIKYTAAPSQTQMLEENSRDEAQNDR